MKKLSASLIAVVLVLAMLLTGCGSGSNNSASEKTSPDASGTSSTSSASGTTVQSDKPATWIADRHLTCRAFIDDLGGTLPEDQANNPIAKKLKELTGMSLEWQYTAGASDLDVMTVAIAAGDLPDLIVYYLDNSSRPEFPILLKAAQEGMFTDVAPMLKNTQIYKKYFEEDYLPNDAKTKVIFRPEFNGAAYIVQMNIARTPGSNVWPYRGGMYLQKSIADALQIDPTTISTQDQLYDLLKKIKAGNFKDKNGNAVYPLGPGFWGGATSASLEELSVANNFYFGVSGGFNLKDGKIMHEVETDYVYQQIDFFQKLLKERLMNPENFTMDATRAEELSRSNSSAIIANVHNFMDIFKNEEYLPVGPLNDYKGERVRYVKAKEAWCGWSIPSTTKNPEEIVKLLDFLATKEGKLLWNYGIEGENYTMKDGKPVATQAMLDLMKSDRKLANNTGIAMGGNGSNWLKFLGATDLDDVSDFGELSYGQNANPQQYDYAMKLYNDNKVTEKFYDGFPALGYLSDLKDLEPKLKPLLDPMAYKEIKVKAIFAKTPDAAKKIIENYKAQVQQAGLAQFEEYLAKVYQENPKSIDFR